MWQYNDYSELYHHGILGQKWGKRNGPPYPLDAEKHSASEKKAGWRKSLSSDKKKKHIRFQKYMSKRLSKFNNVDFGQAKRKIARLVEDLGKYQYARWDPVEDQVIFNNGYPMAMRYYD